MNVNNNCQIVNFNQASRMMDFSGRRMRTEIYIIREDLKKLKKISMEEIMLNIHKSDLCTYYVRERYVLLDSIALIDTIQYLCRE